MNAKEIAISAALNERFDFPLAGLENFDVLRLDLSQVSQVNSEGARRLNVWVLEMGRAYPKLKIELNKAPPKVVRVLNMIRVQDAGNIAVQSIFVPHYCTKCDLDNAIVLVSREQLSNGGVITGLPSVKCAECGSMMELDVEPQTYFALFR